MPDPMIAQVQAALACPEPEPFLPELAAQTPAQFAARPQTAELLEWAQAAAEADLIPETTYTMYRQFKHKGERSGYERPYFRKRELLTREVLAAWLTGGDGRIDRINDLIWNICEETTWVAPAHEKTDWTIDLFCAETGAELAHALLLLGDRLPEEIRNRVRAEIKERIQDRYLEHGLEYWWTVGRNNWTGVCAGAIGQVFLMLEEEPERRARAIALVVEQLDRFIEHGFEEDGGCLEGIGYWNYGLFHFVAFAEMLRARTGGAIDLLAAEKVKAIARYPLAVALGNGLYASFADSHEHASVMPFLAARFAGRCGASGLLGLTGDCHSWRLTTTLRNITWWDGTRLPAPPLENVLLPVSGIARIVGELDGKPAAVIAKAGHNAEPHNNNDVGSFVLAVDGEVLLCDPGAGLYSKDYFGAKRYENIFANSYGHSVPRINGELQLKGGRYRGEIDLEDGVIRIAFEKAYKQPSLTSAVRTLAFQDGVLALEDRFVFDGAGRGVEEALVTWRDVETGKQGARILGARGVLEVMTADGPLAAERLEEACRANRKKGVLTRLTLERPAASEVAVAFALRYSGR